MLKSTFRIFTLSLVALASIPAVAQIDPNDRIKELEKKLEELDQKYRLLSQRLDTNQDVISEKIKSLPLVEIGKNGFRFRSEDGNFKLALKGVLQTDSRNFLNSVSGASAGDTFLIRRARTILEGTVYRDFDFFFMPDFGGGGSGSAAPTIYDAWLNYRLIPELQFQFGKFKAPLGLERLQTDQYLEFNERGLTANLEPDREIGAKVRGTFWDGALNYDLAIVNGVADAQGPSLSADGDKYKDFEGRVFTHPFRLTRIEAWRGFGIGVGGACGDHQGTGLNALTTGYVTEGQQKFFTYAARTSAAGDQWHLSPQAYYYFGPFWLLGEYTVSDQQLALAKAKIDSQNTAWQIEGGYVLTGENATYYGAKPAHPFDPLHGGGWGALELVGRYGQLAVDRKVFPAFASAGSAREADAFSVGLNWYWNSNIRFSVDYAHTIFSGVAGSSAALPVTKGSENVIISRVQLAF